MRTLTLMERPASPDLRLDKWLWFARFVKSRALASKLVEAGGFQVNGPADGKGLITRFGRETRSPSLGPHVRVISSWPWGPDAARRCRSEIAL